MVVDACIDGFGLFGGKCYSCTETSTGFDTNASACDATAAATVTVTACKSGYALFNGTCKSCIATNPGFDLNTKTCSWAPVVIVGGVANTVYPVTVAGACAAGYYLKFN